MMFPILVGLASIATLQSASAAQSNRIPMSPDRWQLLSDFKPLPLADNAEFLTDPKFPDGIAVIKHGSLLLKDLFFENGTIELDVDPIEGIPAIIFRNRGSDTEEEVYIRPESCPGQECMQYTPTIHNFLAWELFPEYQATASIKPGDWNHVKLVVNGQRLNVYVNGEAAPTLKIPKLEGDAIAGAIRLRGAAKFANLTIRSGVTDDLPPTALADPTDADARLIRNWAMISPIAFPTDRAPAATDVPGDRSWKPIVAGRSGMINLGRAYGQTDGYLTAFTWVKTGLDSDKAQVKHVAMALTGEVWVFLNGRQVISDKNLWDVKGARKPGGRFLLSNSAFDLDLKQGRNEILIGARNNFPVDDLREAWAFTLRLADIDGVQLVQPMGN